MSAFFVSMKKIGVLTSGGDAPGMNACIRAVVRTAINSGLKVSGIYRGYDGMINGEIRDMDSKSVANIIQKGGTILRTARSEEFKTPEGRKKAFGQISKFGIEGLVTIGGDGTFTGAKFFSEEYNIPIIGVPGTIDNDLFGTDFTIGFDTAVNTALDAIDRIRDTAESHGRTFFIEVMGRDTGYIAVYAGIGGGAEDILIPETKTSLGVLDRYLSKQSKSRKSFSIIIVAEGEEEGSAFDIAKQVKAKYPEIEPRVTVLGHIQRGGKPTAMDRVNASRMGLGAVEALLEGERNKMVGIVNDQIKLTPFEEAINKNKPINPALLKLAEILI